MRTSDECHLAGVVHKASQVAALGRVHHVVQVDTEEVGRADTLNIITVYTLSTDSETLKA